MDNTNNAVETVLNELREALRVRGLFLHRYQTNGAYRRVRITYAIHDSLERPRRSDDCVGFKTYIYRLEGTTKRCAAYCALCAMLEYVKEMA